jgi:adenylate cyclase
MFTDMVGYTTLGQRNESLSLALVKEQKKLVRSILNRHKGREVKTMGDAFLVEFPNALDAVRCAYDIQRAVREFNFSLPEERRVHLRVGVHLGDVVESHGDIGGDAVNLASRIESFAQDGGVCLTQQVYDQVANKLELQILTLGRKELKNVSTPVEVYQVVMPWQSDPSTHELDTKRIAVLPFANMSPDPDDEYFADGMTEELIDRLAQVKSLKVIARTSVMKYKGSQKGALEVGRELNTGVLIEGSIRKAGNKVRVTVQMISPGTEEHVWSSRYDSNLDDIFDVQSEIAEKVAGELKILLLESEKRTLGRKQTDNTDAYSDFLRGRELLRVETENSVRQALALFEKAVELDPSYARALVGIAECHQWLGKEAYEPYDLSLQNAKTALTRAVELDPDLPEVHASLSVMHYSEDDLRGTEAEAKRALELNPSLPNPYYMLAEVAAIRGEPEEFVRLTETAYRLDPIRPFFIDTVSYAYLFTGREKEMLEHWRKTEQLAPASTFEWMSVYYLSKGDIEKAKESLSMFQKIRPTDPTVVRLEGEVAALAGDREGALLAIRKIEDTRMGPIAFNFIGCIYHDLGDLDLYFSYMTKAIEAHTIIPVMMMYSPLLAGARADPRYQELLKKLRRQTGLAE